MWEMSRTAVPGTVKNLTGSELRKFFEPYREPYREAYRLTKAEGRRLKAFRPGRVGRRTGAYHRTGKSEKGGNVWIGGLTGARARNDRCARAARGKRVATLTISCLPRVLGFPGFPEDDP